MSLERPRKSIGKYAVEEIRKIKLDRTPTRLAYDIEFRERLPEIRELYKQVEYWHGTGRYRFDKKGEVYDIVSGIAKNHALIPHADEWDRAREKDEILTTSVAPSRMYARLYAGTHCPAGTRIENELGSRELWGHSFLTVSALRGMLEYWPHISQLRRGDDSSTFIPGYKNKSEAWIKQISAQDHNLKDIFLHGTDIAENYPVLFGFKKGSLVPTKTSAFIGLFEKRTEQSIAIEQFTHVEVPYRNVAETERVFEDAGEHVRVLPIECGEEYCRKYSFLHLWNGKPLE